MLHKLVFNLNTAAPVLVTGLISFCKCSYGWVEWKDVTMSVHSMMTWILCFFFFLRKKNLSLAAIKIVLYFCWHFSLILILQKEVAQLTCECERHIGTQSGGMDQVLLSHFERFCSHFKDFFKKKLRQWCLKRIQIILLHWHCLILLSFGDFYGHCIWNFVVLEVTKCRFLFFGYFLFN